MTPIRARSSLSLSLLIMYMSWSLLITITFVSSAQRICSIHPTDTQIRSRSLHPRSRHLRSTTSRQISSGQQRWNIPMYQQVQAQDSCLPETLLYVMLQIPSAYSIWNPENSWISIPQAVQLLLPATLTKTACRNSYWEAANMFSVPARTATRSAVSAWITRTSAPAR